MAVDLTNKVANQGREYFKYAVANAIDELGQMEVEHDDPATTGPRKLEIRRAQAQILVHSGTVAASGLALEAEEVEEA